MVQILKIYHATQEGCIHFGNMYNDFVPGCAILVRRVTGKGETFIYLTLSDGKAMQVITYFYHIT